MENIAHLFVRATLPSRAAIRVGVALCTLAAANTALAQDAPASPAATAPEEDTIVVTGFRRSVQNSIEVKRQSDVVAEIVTSDDIAGLPDVSIAESISRLPGITSQRTGGQSSALNIRGLSQELVSATLNGREQVSTSGGRDIQFDQYPSELINQVAVYKSPKASLIEGGVAGKVELSTVRPLTNKKRLTVQANVRASYNDRAHQSPDADEFGYRASGSIQYKFSDTFAVAIGYARLVQPNIATRFVGFDYTGNRIPVNGVLASPNFGFELIQFGGTETRDAGLAVIQFEPSPDFRFLLDGYYSKFNSDVRRRGIRIQGSDRIAAADVSNATVFDHSIIGATERSGSGLSATLVNQIESRSDELYTIGGNVAKDFGKLTVSFDGAFSRASSYFNNAGLNVDAFNDAGTTRLQSIPGALVATYQYDRLNLPRISINHDFTNPQTNLFQGFYIVPRYDTDELLAFAPDATLKVGNSWLKSVQIGARYSDRNAARRITSFDSFGIASAVVVPSQFLTVRGFEGQEAANGFPRFLSADITGVLHQFVGPNLTATQNQQFTIDQSYTIDESVIDGYAQLNLDRPDGKLPFRGNIGVRVVNTAETGNGSSFIYATNTRAFYTVRDNYTDILPSFNGIFLLSKNDQIRLAVARQISRPNFIDLRPSVDLNFGRDGVPVASGGNTRLRPFLANQFDIGYEHYFNRNGLFSAQAFYKNLETFIVNQQSNNFNFRQQGYGNLLDSAVLQPNSSAKQDVGRFNRPANGTGGEVYGFEINFTKSFKDELPAPFDGLGVILNYSYTESSLNITVATGGSPQTITLPGLSKHVASPTVFYEKNGFETRVSVRYRSPYVAPQVGLTSNPAFNGEETVIDAQLAYTFQPGSRFAGVKLLAQGENLTDEPNTSYWGREQRTSTIQSFGRVFYLGAAYKF